MFHSKRFGEKNNNGTNPIKVEGRKLKSERTCLEKKETELAELWGVRGCRYNKALFPCPRSEPGDRVRAVVGMQLVRGLGVLACTPAG